MSKAFSRLDANTRESRANDVLAGHHPDRRRERELAARATVDDDPHHPALAGRGHDEIFEIEPGAFDDRSDQADDPLTGRGGHVDLTFAGWGAVRSPVESGLARALQRVGRAGHLVGQTSKGRMIPRTNGDLLVTVEVVVPQRLSKEQRDALSAYAAASSGQDPRADLVARAADAAARASSAHAGPTAGETT